MSLLGLPQISPELKPITPYLQRAHELNKQDPIIAYWCAYYAAQLGISLKARDSTSRDILFALLGVLERMKKTIGSHDAIDIESVSSAYVENFALKVFTMADNEDRAGNPTRSTAKKFLAAANFFEVLKTFPKSESSDNNAEKIKYAKWKAADIAKAFREGRQPTPGPAGSSLQRDADLISPASPPEQTPNIVISNGDRHSPPSLPSRGSPSSIKRSSPPTHVDIPHPQTPPQNSRSHLDVDVQGHAKLSHWGGEGEATPGSWSTAATPGTAHESSVEWDQQESPTISQEKKKSHKPRSGSGSSMESSDSKGTRRTTKPWMSKELDSFGTNQYHPSHGNGGTIPGSAGTNSSENSKKSVHFTPSVVGGLSESSLSNSPTASTLPSYNEHEHEHEGGNNSNWTVDPLISTAHQGLPSQGNGVADMYILPPGFMPDHQQRWATETGTQPIPVITPPSPPSNNTRYSPPRPPAPPSIPAHNPYTHNPSIPPPELELTPAIIAKAQKHCRFAISALDYEDAEQARKELRAALAVLGG